MRPLTLTERLGPFEVFPGKDLVPGHPLVARLVGRRFDEILDGVGYTKPFDPSFGKGMVKTLSYLLTVLGASFGFAEQTELSLFAIAGGGDARRLLSRIAGEASAKLSLVLGSVCTFETRLYQLEDTELAVEYFRWRQEEAHMRAVHRYCSFALAQSGTETLAAERILSGLGTDERIELLRQHGVDFHSVPAWQQRGAAVSLRPAKEGESPDDGQDGRARLVVNLNLPMSSNGSAGGPDGLQGDGFGDYLRPILTAP